MRYDEILQLAERKIAEQGLSDTFTFQGTETGYSRLSNDVFFRAIAFKLRTIDTLKADTRTTLFGQQLATPIIAGAMSRPAWKMDNCLTAWAEGVKEAGYPAGCYRQRSFRCTRHDQRDDGPTPKGNDPNGLSGSRIGG